MKITAVSQQAKTTSFLPSAQGILQRKCACGNHTMAGGECAECMKKKMGIQRKLAIGAGNDPLELEADRMADQVMAMPLNSRINTSPPRVQRFIGQTSDGLTTAPASVDRVLASSGRPLESALRQDMESRFGYDFSQVRVHTGSAAEQSALDLNAHAYTAGNNVVFGTGWYQPGTIKGRHLLAHELTHTLQQKKQNGLRNSIDGFVQRFVSCEDTENCPARETGEITHSRSDPMELFEITSGGIGLLLSNFSVGASGIRGDMSTNSRWNSFISEMIANPNITWEILGFTDCQGDETLNTSLRISRATSLFLALPDAAMSQVDKFHAAPLTDCIRNNTSEENRRLNRSAIIRQKSISYDFEPETVTGRQGPTKPTGSPTDFCVPYTTSTEVSDARRLLFREWIPYANTVFGGTVASLWTDYLNRAKGSSLSRRVFTGSGVIASAFRDATETIDHRDQLFDDTAAAMRLRPEATSPLSSLGGLPYTSSRVPLSSLLPATSLSRTINYGNAATTISGNIAGGTGSSDAGPDRRIINGEAWIWRNNLSSGEIKVVFINLDFQIIDAIDFCPGGWGGFLAQRYTTPMSRLEATPWTLTYDLPFEVNFRHSGARTI